MGQRARHWWRVAVAGLIGLGLAAAPSASAGSGGPASGGPAMVGASASAITSVVTTPAKKAPATSAALAPKLKNMPVYWVGQSRRSFALYREFREVPSQGGPVASAVSAMTRLKPLDPDYLTPWRPASRVRTSQRGAAITVDLSADAFANTRVGSQLAHRAVQQLVYTATAASVWARTPGTSVKITVNGRAFDAWGVVRLGKPMRRASMATVQAHTWVVSPQQGEVRRPGTVTFKGFGTSFEANFVWTIRRASGVLVAKGFTTGGRGVGTFGSFAFTARLGPGSYTVVVSGEDASGGAEGPGAAFDTKAFRVR